MTLEVDNPCLALLTLVSETPDQAQVRVTLADPQQQLVHMNLTLHYSGRSTSTQVTMPAPPRRGSSVSIMLTV